MVVVISAFSLKVSAIRLCAYLVGGWWYAGMCLSGRLLVVGSYVPFWEGLVVGSNMHFW
jgi:hypothetical protein